MGGESWETGWRWEVGERRRDEGKEGETKKNERSGGDPRDPPPSPYSKDFDW